MLLVHISLVYILLVVWF